MFGRNTHTLKLTKPFEPRPLRTISIEEVLTPIPELGTQEPYHESYFWWINPENFTHHTPTEKSNSIWYTPYPENDQRSSPEFEIPEEGRKQKDKFS